MVISAALLFALNGTVSKVVLQSGISSLELTQVRATGAFLGFALVLALTRRDSLRLTRRELPYLIVFGIAGVAFVQWLYFVSIGRLPIGIALLIEYIGADPDRDLGLGRSSRSRSAAGSGSRSCSRSSGSRSSSRSGAACRSTGSAWPPRSSAAVAYAVYVLMAEHAVKLARPRVADRVRLPLRRALLGARSAALALPDGTARRQRLAARPPRAASRCPVWLLLLYVVVAGTMVTFLLVAAALRHISATRVGIVAMLEPVAASAVAFLWLGESFGRRSSSAVRSCWPRSCSPRRPGSSTHFLYVLSPKRVRLPSGSFVNLPPCRRFRPIRTAACVLFAVAVIAPVARCREPGELAEPDRALASQRRQRGSRQPWSPAAEGRPCSRPCRALLHRDDAPHRCLQPRRHVRTAQPLRRGRPGLRREPRLGNRPLRVRPPGRPWLDGESRPPRQPAPPRAGPGSASARSGARFGGYRRCDRRSPRTSPGR